MAQTHFVLHLLRFHAGVCCFAGMMPLYTLATMEIAEGHTPAAFAGYVEQKQFFALLHLPTSSNTGMIWRRRRSTFLKKILMKVAK